MMTTWKMTFQWSITLLVTDPLSPPFGQLLALSEQNWPIDKSQVCLDVMECTTGDAGQYALIVTNKKGESKAAFSLNV